MIHNRPGEFGGLSLANSQSCPSDTLVSVSEFSQDMVGANTPAQVCCSTIMITNKSVSFSAFALGEHAVAPKLAE